MASVTSPLTRLLLGNLADVPPQVRQRMLATIPTTPLSLAFYSFTLIVICATAVYISGGATWAWAWLGSSVLLLAWRAIHPLIALHRGQSQPLLSIMVSAGLSMASFGFGAVQSILTGDNALMAISLSGAMGVVAGLATRWAALPRPAIAAMVLTMGPPAVMMIIQGGAYTAAALVIVFVVLSIASFTKHNQENLLAAITAEDLHRRMAQTDHLTGLANRVQLTDQMQLACEDLPKEDHSRGRRFAVLYIDLDGFKAINDNHGHAAGDEMLQRVADCLRQATGPDEMVARIGGDEFVVLLRDADALTARGVADEIIGAISREHRIADGRALRVGCSVGICLAPDQGREPETLLARADAALYEVKNQGKGHTGVWRALGEV
jgi:diguanylate cyclase (GGDEF)-like protein